MKRAPSYVLAVIPKKAFIDWLKHLIENLEIQFPPDMKFPAEDDFYSDCPLFLVPPFAQPEILEKFIREHYATIFINVLNYWSEDFRFWPIKEVEDVTPEKFKEFFDLEMHSNLYDLTSKDE